jgi:hypothetical protein
VAGCTHRPATLNPDNGIEPAATAVLEKVMRAETLSLVDEIKQSLALLRRHL